jgi:hypothetical protein
MATAKDVLDVARSQLGVVESPPGSNQVLYASWAGIPGLAWCGAFVCWVLDRAGALDVPTFVWTPSGAQAYKDRGRWDHTPSIGDVVFFTWPEVGRICHVGFVEAVRDDGSVVTIEGNTDERGGGTGGKVMRHVRRAYMTGFGQPAYSALAPATPTAPAVPVGVAQRPMIRRGSRGPNVLFCQKRLGAHKINPGPEDGIFGPATDKAVRQFQRSKKLVVDGIVGPRTWAALGG